MTKKLLWDSASWWVSVTLKFFRVTPFYTSFIIALTLISQISQLLAFFLPLKVVILLGSNTIPSYFPSFLGDLGIESLVVLLSFLSALSYVAYLIADKLVEILSAYGAEKLLARSKKMAMFNKQKEFSFSTYQRYAKSLASIVFTSMAMVVMYFLYADLFLAFFIYLGFSFVLLCFLCARSEKICSVISGNIKSTTSIASGVGFLVVFSFLVIKFLLGVFPSFLIAVLSLILARQSLNRISLFVTDVWTLYGQRERLNAVFFHSHVLSFKNSSDESGLWKLLENRECKKLLQKLAVDKASLELKVLSLFWLQSSLPNIYQFSVEALDFNDIRKRFVFKIYGSGKEAFSENESLILHDVSSLPALGIIFSGYTDEYNCRLFDYDDFRFIELKSFKESKIKFLASLMLCSPGGAVVSRYKRSKPMLWERINDEMVKRLRVLAESLKEDFKEALEIFFSKREDVFKILMRLPLSIVNHDIGPYTLLERENGEVAALHWGHWSLEPLGAGWPTDQLDRLNCLDLKNIADKRKVDHLSIDEVKISALVFEFEQSYRRQHYCVVFSLVKKIVGLLR
ncbi:MULTISPECIES: hypothetical protein [Chromohalobacter]|uniref:Uncharacterized protein n=1 Tax=Chromohalobacter moromii TaxID=2860329 RepID=A0A9X3AW58_9GAMM|nr:MULTISPECIES: hypothetical protein [Chromohalobacter]MCK2045079.1 hypothetical protein [Chromohalobacter moromii]MCT8468065.1 hypothetical protein [Chromohalobacter canadensis]MCT8498564.1 hypothetical protein [Chromohalobacter canadensis]MCT8503772.1 hypothetical protein [Chromohalobacter moromii]